MRFLLEIASETIGSEYLQGAEQHEMPQLLAEIFFIHRFVFRQGIYILAY